MTDIVFFDILPVEPINLIQVQFITSNMYKKCIWWKDKWIPGIGSMGNKQTNTSGSLTVENLRSSLC